MNLDEIQQIFFQECDEGLATMEASFASVRQGGHDHETINTIFRSVHSIKRRRWRIRARTAAGLHPRI